MWLSVLFELGLRAYISQFCMHDSSVTCLFALRILSTDSIRFMWYKRLLKAQDYSQRVSRMVHTVFHSTRATFPLLGERSGAITCLGDNRSTDTFMSSFWDVSSCG